MKGKYMFKRLSNLSNPAVLGILLAIAIASSGLSLVVNIVNNVDTSPAWWVSWLQNFSTEMLGAFLTFILLELIVGGREKRRDEERAMMREKEKLSQAMQDKKTRLINELGSSVNQIATRAAEELRLNGWIEDGSLHKIGLAQANLENVNLMDADLQMIDFMDANLQNAKLGYSNLHKACLLHTNFENAELSFVNLSWSDLELANFQGADLVYANMRGAIINETILEGANLRGANFQGVKLETAYFDEKTTLPDGTLWTSDTDLDRFTNLLHPQFWRSKEPKSPAYNANTSSR
jgi:hypothetical protein